MSQESSTEIFIGLVAPIGSNLKIVEEKLKENLEKNGYNTIPIKITDIFDFSSIKGLPNSLKYYLKMELCTQLRGKLGTGILAAMAIKKIDEKRKKSKKENGQKNAYIINQIKNKGEYDLLSNIYDINYIQISCFSNKNNQDKKLKDKFKDSNTSTENLDKLKKTKGLIKEDFLKNKFPEETLEKLIEEYIKEYQEKILPDATHKLIEKDRIDPSQEDKNGQQIDDIFHESHYFINLDRNDTELNSQVSKFVDLLFGKYNEYPTQDEFGMSLAHAASVRSNFPGQRQIGSCIISKMGEVISVGSIKAPAPHSNPNKIDEDNIADGYHKIKEKIKKWTEEIKKNQELCKFIKDSIDFHPCTHAELSAILDAAKQGVSIRGATLYTTTFPCHLCARDIISGGISKVVFCEAYPKSKNEELYSNILEIDPESPSDDKVPFNTFFGVGPKRYHYVYNLKAKAKEDLKENIPPLLKYRSKFHYKNLEKEIISFVDPNSESAEFIAIFESLLKVKKDT